MEQGVGSLDELCDTFRIHRRLLIEALVTLTRAGWLAVSSVPSKSFIITPEGCQALLSGDSPSSLLIQPKETCVLTERLTGQTLSYRDLRYVSERELEVLKADYVRLTPRVSDQHVDGSVVQHLLQRAQGEWIRWIGPIDLVGRDFHWLPVTADLKAGSISGLPDGWRHLNEILIEEAGRRATTMLTVAGSAVWFQQSSGRPAGQEAPKLATPEWLVTLTAPDFLHGSIAHERYVRQVLQSATSSVFIASAFVGTLRLDAIGDALAEALHRGVSVDLLWGYGATREALNWLAKQAADAKRQACPGRLRFNRNPSESHAKLVIWDRSQNEFEACIGSCNWLSFGPAAPSTCECSEVSVKVSRPGLVAQLGRCAASLCEATREVLSAVPSRWQRVAADLDRLESTEPFTQAVNAKLKLIFDHEHEWALREWLRTAQQRLLVASHRIGPVAATRLVAAEGRTRDPNFSYAVVFGYTELDAVQLEQVHQMVGNAGGSLLHAPHQHAKVIVCDDLACVSSYNFLSSDPFQTASGCASWEL